MFGFLKRIWRWMGGSRKRQIFYSSEKGAQIVFRPIRGAIVIRWKRGVWSMVSEEAVGQQDADSDGVLYLWMLKQGYEMDVQALSVRLVAANPEPMEISWFQALTIGWGLHRSIWMRTPVSSMKPYWTWLIERKLKGIGLYAKEPSESKDEEDARREVMLAESREIVPFIESIEKCSSLHTFSNTRVALDLTRPLDNKPIRQLGGEGFVMSIEHASCAFDNEVEFTIEGTIYKPF